MEVWFFSITFRSNHPPECSTRWRLYRSIVGVVYSRVLIKLRKKKRLVRGLYFESFWIPEA
jgi:hypothetical protein